jgi:signal transduction histidine kinase/ligand-binding sensor domain-containing protein
MGRRCLLLVAALAGWPLAAAAGPPPLQVAQYAHTAWTAQDGANLGSVFAMAQTPDGYLWIGGSLGLFRFDGLRFQPWQPPGGQSLPSTAYSLLVSRDGTLWIGTYGGLSSWNGREFVHQHAEIGRQFVTTLLEDRDGTVWAGVLGAQGAPGKLCAIRAGRIECSAPEDGGFGNFVWSLAEDRDGALWVGAESGLGRWRPGPPRRHAMPGLRVGDLTTTPDGEVLASVFGGGLRQLAGGRLIPHRIGQPARRGDPLAERDIKANKLLRDRDGGLWIGTEGIGLMHVKDGLTDTFTRADGLSGNIACSLFEDREGNIWFGSHKGLDRFRKLPVATLSAKQGLPHELTRAVLAARDGSVWVSTNDGLVRWKNGSATVYRERDGLPDPQQQSLHEDAQGRLWVNTPRGLVRFANGRFIRVERGPSRDIHAIVEDAAGDLWLSGNQGLARVRQGRFLENLPWSSFGRREPAYAMVADRGGLWLGFWDRSGVSYVKDGKVEATFTTAQGLGERHVASLRLDADGAVWAATGGGLSRIKEGRVTTLTAANGLSCNRIHWSLPDAQGALWVYTVCGLSRIDRDDLAAWIADPRRRVTPKLWTGTDGVPLQVQAPSYFNPPVATDTDGRIWFTGVAEVQVFDPARMLANPVPPPVHIGAVVADHQSHAAVPDLRLPPLVRDITIEFAALTLVDPKSTRFRYRLEGHDREWQEAVDRRQATYTNLPPGQYRFHVTAANNSGVWNEQGAQLPFTILPAFYQTPTFHLAAAVLLLGLAWTAFHLWLRLRIRRLHRQFEATLEARVAERTRIARDLHDTLLQHFHGLLLQLQAAMNLLPERPNESRQLLAGTIDRAAEAITEGRDTVQGLRTAAPSNDLAHALRLLADELVHECAAGCSVHVDVQGRPHELHPLVRDESLRIAAEALRNAVHHADAQRIDVEVCYEPRLLRVAVRDNGKGIETEVLRRGEKEGHFGLRGMRERARLIGGRLDIRRRPQGGTEVELLVPGSQPSSQPSRGWARWLRTWTSAKSARS